MKLDREKAIDILDKFYFFQGQRAGRELWRSKTFEAQEQDISDFSRDVALLKCYINEITGENKRLTGHLSQLEHRYDICKQNVTIAKADTLKDVQMRFAMHFGTYTDDAEVKVSEVFKLLSKFAEEMLEGEI